MRQIVFLFASLVLCSLPGPARAFDVAWVDQFGESTYRISGPDAVVTG